MSNYCLYIKKYLNVELIMPVGFVIKNTIISCTAYYAHTGMIKNINITYTYLYKAYKPNRTT